MQSATWSKAVVRMGTDKYGGNGELTCWSAAIRPMGVAAGGDKTGGQLAQCESATWSETGGRTDTDSNGQEQTINLLERCDKTVSP